MVPRWGRKLWVRNFWAEERSDCSLPGSGLKVTNWPTILRLVLLFLLRVCSKEYLRIDSIF